MFKPLTHGVLAGTLTLTMSAFAFESNNDFQVIHTKSINDTNSVAFLADVAGAIKVGKDYRPTTDTNSPLYKFKTLTHFLHHGKKLSGHVASINIINCHDRTFLQGMTWYYVDDHAPPAIIPPQNDFEPMSETHVFYEVGKTLCHW